MAQSTREKNVQMVGKTVWSTINTPYHTCMP